MKITRFEMIGKFDEDFERKLAGLARNTENSNIALAKAKKNPQTQKRREEHLLLKQQKEKEIRKRQEEHAEEKKRKKKANEQIRQEKEEKAKAQENALLQRKMEFASLIGDGVDLSKVKNLFEEDLKNPEFLKFAVATSSDIVPYLDAKQVLTLSFAKEQSGVFMEKLADIRASFGTIPTIKFLRYMYNSKDGYFTFQAFLDKSKEINKSDYPYLVWAMVADASTGIVRLKDFDVLEDEEKMALLKNDEFMKTNYERFRNNNKRFARALPCQSVELKSVKGYFEDVFTSTDLSSDVKSEMKGIYQNLVKRNEKAKGKSM